MVPMANTKKFYVTTPIYYATAAPHLGTLYSTVLADVVARWKKLCGNEVFFLTGTDEFGQKVAQAAAEAGMDPQTFVDGFIGAYKDLWKAYEIDYSQFMRTTSPYHVKAVQGWIKKLIDKGDIYKGEYQGWYCIPDETFLNEKDIVGMEKRRAGSPEDHDVALAKADAPPCVSCGRPTVRVSEVCYFFRLSAYQDRLLEFYKNHPDFIMPQERFAEVISFVKGGLQDLSISRTTLTWGVPFPDDDAHVTYVWADALNNYITAIGYGQEGREAEFKKWWPADLQVMGKDIVRFHAIHWPAFLMAAELPMPHHLLVHGWIKVGDQKMSKSLGNVINPNELLSKYGADAIRYYLLKQLAITQDGQFSIADLEQKITSDLANDLGNLLNRMSVLAEKNGLLTLQPGVWQEQEIELHKKALETIKEFKREMDRGYFHMALAAVWKYVSAVNGYFHACEPWKLGKTNPERCATVLSATAHGLHTIATLLWPVMPTKMEELFAALGCTFEINGDTIAALENNSWNKVFTMHKIDPLFQKPEVKDEPVTAVIVTPELPATPEISIEDFMKIELRVGTIEACTEVKGSEKLLRLEADFGPHGKRIVFSGIKKSYAPEQLIGKQGVFVFNLKPRKMMGELSHGMLLAAGDTDDTVVIMSPSKEVPNGNLVK